MELLPPNDDLGCMSFSSSIDSNEFFFLFVFYFSKSTATDGFELVFFIETVARVDQWDAVC